MRYSFTAILALAASSLAAPVIDKRDVLVLTQITTIITTETVTTTDYVQPTPTPVNVEGYGDRNHRSKRRSSSRTFQYPGPSSSSVTVTVPTSTVEPTSTPQETTPPSVAPTTEPVSPTTISESETTDFPTTISEPETSTTPAFVPETTTTTTSKPTTTATPVPTPVPTDDSFESEVLNAHNKYRAMHGAPALTWDSTMASFAKSVSSKCVFKHSGGGYGENLAAGYGTPALAIKAWYDENTMYDYEAGQFGSGTGHFTQVVWKSTTSMGCGIASCDGASGTPGDFLTCEYNTGNVIGQFVKNVLPPV